VQYGALGLVAALMAFAVRILFKRETEAHDRDRERADKLFDRLEQVNQESRNNLVSFGETLRVVAQALQALSEALTRIDPPRRRRDDPPS
jgi:hypothetical protein